MKEQWKRLDGDAKLILNLEEGRSVPVNIEFPLSTIIRKKESCCRKLLTFLKVLVLIVILSILGWLAAEPIQQTPNQGQVHNFVQNSEKSNIVIEILVQNEKLIQKDSQILDGESNNEKTDSETNVLDIKEDNSGTTFLDVLLREILEVNAATEKNDGSTALLEPSNDYVKDDPKFDRTDEVNDEEYILNFLKSIGLFNCNNNKDADSNKEKLVVDTSESDEIVSEEIINHRQENALNTENKSKNGIDEKLVGSVWIKHPISIEDETLSSEKSEFSDIELIIGEKGDESEKNGESDRNYSGVKTESSERRINYSIGIITKASGERITPTFAPDEFLKIWDKLKKEHRMEAVLRYLEPIVGRRNELLSWYLNNKNCLNFENDKLKCHTARSLYNTDVSEFYDDLGYVITQFYNNTLTRSSDSDNSKSTSESNMRSHILNTLILKKYVKDMLETEEFDDKTAQWALEGYIESLQKELTLYSEEQEENYETIGEKETNETAMQSMAFMNKLGKSVSDELGKERQSFLSHINETGTLNNQLSDENTNDYDVELEDRNTASTSQEPDTVSDENTDLLKIENKSEISKNSDEFDLEHQILSSIMKMMGNSNDEIAIEHSNEYDIDLNKENIEVISKDPEAVATQNQESSLNDYLEPNYQNANNHNELTITDERRNDDKPMYDSLENISSNGPNQHSQEVDEPTTQASDENSQELSHFGHLFDSLQNHYDDNDGGSRDFLPHGIYYGDNYDSDKSW